MAYSLTAIAFLLAYLAVAVLLGAGVLARLGAWRAPPTPPAPTLLSAVTGIGLAAFVLFLLALADGLRPLPVLLVFASLAAVCAWWLRLHAPGWTAARRAALADAARRAKRQPLAAAGIALVAAAAALLSMGAPLEWDELSYHLPYARDYANAGGLVVSEYLRFPLQAHNLQLTYATALLFAPAAAAHLVHAACGALLVAGVYACARDGYGRPTATLAAALTLLACHDLADTALVDLGLAMFVFCAFWAFSWWLRHGQAAWLTVAAFLLAMAAGTKYQGLLQLPLFALALLVATRDARAWARVAVTLLLFGTGWYLRNAVISGDPLHPFGARIFGFWLWDAGDLAGQYADVARYGHHLPLVLLPAVAFVILPGRRRPEDIALAILGLGGLLAWYLTSRYDRYLLPTWPFLAILSAHVLVTAWRRLAARRERPQGSPRRSLPPRAWALLCVAAVAAVVYRQWDETCLTQACVEEVWARELPAWRVIESVPEFDRLAVYQFGLENQMYLLGGNTVGDWYGPYRYRAVEELLDQPGALPARLRAMGRDAILVNRARPWFDRFPPSGGLPEQFETLYEDEAVALYRIADR